MSFTSNEFLIFFAVVFTLYWFIPKEHWQNLLLFVASYFFYGWIQPWLALMLGLSTLADYAISIAIPKYPARNKRLLTLSLIINLGVLGFFKYYGFFNDSLYQAFSALGFQANLFLSKIILPAGLSFYTLKKIAYMVDVSRGTLKPTRNPITFALFVSFFPQIAAGPIDKAQKLIPQFERPRMWTWENLYSAWPLIVGGAFKKIVIADTIGTVISSLFYLNETTILLAIAAALGFMLQILADFSAYTDLSRGVSYLLGLDTSENFNSPYLSLTPTEFWNRWHITLSNWLRDYIFFPLRRALLRRKNQIPTWIIQSVPPLVTMLVSGIWHGAGWNFVLWGGMYGVLIVIYQSLGIRGDWNPVNKFKWFIGWLIMSSFIAFGWLLFGAPSLAWVGNVFSSPFLGTSEQVNVALLSFTMIAFFSAPMIIKMLIDKYWKPDSFVHSFYFVVATVMIIFYINSTSPDFIYFQF